MEKYLILILILYILEIGFGYWLDSLNISHLKLFGSVIPPEFEGQIDQALLEKTRDYTIENIRFGIIASIFNNIVIIVFIFGGVLDIYNSWIAGLNLPFIISGLIFFMLLTYVSMIFSMPFSLYRSFRIEKKYGFNTMTFKLWLSDFIKSALLSTIILVILVISGLWIIKISPEFWWFWVWGMFFIFSIFIMYISPYVIEPLFNKFTPVENESLIEGIRNLLQKVGIKVGRVFKMDASKRTRHTNAYFTGIGRVKRIVLYDTLLNKMKDNEVLAVLAHEVGHWKKKHLLKHLILIESISLVSMYISFRVLQSDILIGLFGIEYDTFFVKVLILAFLGSIVIFPFTPAFNYLSRRHEIEADKFSYGLTGDAEAMISTLVKLSKDNLSNIHPHPLYAAFHYSHPPVLKRIKIIKKGYEIT